MGIASPSLARIQGWDEDTTQTLVTLGADGAFQKIDTLGASRVIVSVLTNDRTVFVSPEDLSSADVGIPLRGNDQDTTRNEPGQLEIYLGGNPGLWLRNTTSAGTCEVAVVHFYSSPPMDSDYGGVPMRVRGWDESTRLKEVTVGTTAEIVDTEGASRVLFVPMSADVYFWLSPTDTTTSKAGIAFLRDGSTDNLTVPTCLEVEAAGGAMWIRASSGSSKYGKLTFFD